MTHPMSVEVLREQGKTVFTCRVCERCIEISTDGALSIIHRGDQRAQHTGGSYSIAVDIKEQGNAQSAAVLH